MPYARAGTPYYWISYTDAVTGKQVRRSAGTTDFKEAKALEQKLRAKQHDDRKRNQVDVRLDVVLDEYLAVHDTPPMRSAARQLLRLADRWCSDLNTAVVRAYVKERQAEGAAAGTINRETGMISAAINRYNLDHAVRIHNPIRGTRLREPEGRLRYLTRGEYDRLVAAADGQVRDVIILAVQTGMRKGELLPLTWDQVNMIRKEVTLEAWHTKTKRRRVIPLNKTAMEVLTVMERVSQYVFPSRGSYLWDFRITLDHVCRRAGVERVTLHELRHTCASWLVQAGVPLYEVAKVLGHTSIKTTHRYAHLAPDHLRSAVDAIG